MSRAFKWIIVLAILAAIIWFLYWMGGEQPLERIEQPVETIDIEAA